jgi:hypothetical protein
MIHVHLVVDGPRDAATLPKMVSKILQTEFKTTAKHWADIRLHGRSGYVRKVRFATRQARDLSADGLVAVVHSDKDPKRIGELRKGRDEERIATPPFPTALGQAVPQGEAWLLDDPKAIREALNLVPHPRLFFGSSCFGVPRNSLDLQGSNLKIWRG